MSRVLGRTAASAVVAAVSVVSLGAGPASAGTGPDAADAAAVPSWSVDTSAPEGLTAIPGGGSYAYVPPSICSVDWTVIGGQGGADAGGVAGGVGGELRVTTRGLAGQVVLLHPGTDGQPWSTGAAGGTNGVGPAGGAGTAGGGGGGAGSAVRLGTSIELVARGGAGGGATGGAGGSTGATASGNTVTPGTGGPIVIDTVFDGSTGAAGGSGRGGAGVVRGVGTPCPATAPGAPQLTAVPTIPEDDGIHLRVRPGTPRGSQVWAPVTGWEVTLDGGVTWRPLPTSPLLEGERPPGTTDDGSRRAFVRGLALGEHTIAVRVTSTAGSSAASEPRTVRLFSTPTGVTVTAGVSSLRVSWTPPAGEVRSFTAESYDAAQAGEGDPHSLCEAAPGQHSCTMHAEPGRSYRVVLSSIGRQAPPVTSGVVASPPVPTAVPPSSGVLQVPASSREPAAGSVVEVSGDGYLPRSTVSVVVYSAPVLLASVEVDEAGAFRADVTLPVDLPAGQHTLLATGVDPDGQTRDLTQLVTVQAVAAPPSAGPSAGPAPAVTATSVSATAVPSSGGLAHTGAYVGVMAVGGVLTLVVGIALVLVGRRRRTAGRG